MAIRKIYVRDGEQVEIRVVSPDYGLNAQEWEMSFVRPYKYLAIFRKRGFEIPIWEDFKFKMGGHLFGPLKESNAMLKAREL